MEIFNFLDDIYRNESGYNFRFFKKIVTHKIKKVEKCYYRWGLKQKNVHIYPAHGIKHLIFTSYIYKLVKTVYRFKNLGKKRQKNAKKIANLDFFGLLRLKTQKNNKKSIWACTEWLKGIVLAQKIFFTFFFKNATPQKKVQNGP